MVVASRTAGSYGSLLRNRNFSLLVLAYAINTFGNWITVVAALALATFEWHASPVQVGGVIAVFLVPPVIASPAAGWLGDRLNKKHLLIVANLGAAFVVVWMPFAENIWQAYGILLTLRCLSAVNQPAMSALVPSLVPKSDLLRANSLLLQPVHVTRAISPVVGGLIVTVSNVSVAFLVDGVTFLIACLILAALQVPGLSSSDAAAEESTHSDEVTTPGLSWQRVLLQPRFLHLASVAMTASFAFGALESVAPVYVRDLLGERAILYGASVSCLGVGSVMGGLLPGLLRPSAVRGRGLFPGTFAMASGFVLIAALHLPVALLAGVLIAGFGAGWVLTTGQTMIHEQAPATSYAIVLGVLAAVLNLGSVAGIFLASVLASGAGVGLTLWACAVPLGAVVVWSTPAQALLGRQAITRGQEFDGPPVGPPLRSR
jgi:MFS family permease